MMENEIPVCCICRHKVKLLKFEARLIIEKDSERMKKNLKHFSIHTCLIRVKGRARKAEVTK